MKNALLVAVFSLLMSMAASSSQGDKACPYGKGLLPHCLPETHPVAECVCDGPSGPCHWAWHCEKDYRQRLTSFSFPALLRPHTQCAGGPAWNDAFALVDLSPACLLELAALLE
jgi:hypothetical protein